MMFFPILYFPVMETKPNPHLTFPSLSPRSPHLTPYRSPAHQPPIPPLCPGCPAIGLGRSVGRNRCCVATGHAFQCHLTERFLESHMPTCALTLVAAIAMIAQPSFGAETTTQPRALEITDYGVFLIEILDGRLTRTRLSGPVADVWDVRRGNSDIADHPVPLALRPQPRQVTFKAPVVSPLAAKAERAIVMHSMPNCSWCDVWWRSAADYASEGWQVSRYMHDPPVPGDAYPWFEVSVGGRTSRLSQLTPQVAKQFSLKRKAK